MVAAERHCSRLKTPGFGGGAAREVSRGREETRIEAPTGRFLASVRKETDQVRPGRNRAVLQAGKDIESKVTDAEKAMVIISGRERMALGGKGDGEEEGCWRRLSARTK